MNRREQWSCPEAAGWEAPGFFGAATKSLREAGFREARKTGPLVLLCCAVLALGLLCPVAHAQTDEWNWMGGSSEVLACSSGSPYCGQPGVYGTLQTPAAGNIPSARHSGASWSDSKGNLWIFGGWGLDVTGTVGLLNDLWEFNPSTNEWAWMGGSSMVPGFGEGQYGVYGSLGKAAVGNIPGGREGASTWIDASGNLWLFGGTGIDSAGTQGGLNDLWKFNPSTNEWAWVSGSSTLPGLYADAAGAYGTLGQPAEGNVPGGRSGAAGWRDSKGNLWLFGGVGLNDLWEFNPSSGEWAWMGGSSAADIYGQPGVYGTLGTPAPANAPGSRANAVAWSGEGGKFWLFGGRGIDLFGVPGWLNDLWEFNPSTGQWTWMGGSDFVGGYCYNEFCGMTGVYGTLGRPAAGNVPGSRFGAVGWSDSRSNLWLFGGYGFDSQGFYGDLNDLWKFQPSTNQWTWMSGSESLPGFSMGQSGVYGTLQTPASGDTPGGRDSAVGWSDSKGNLWIFGGDGYDSVDYYGILNDLWEFQLDAGGLPVAATPAFSLDSGSYTSVQTVTISDTTPGATIYYFLNGSASATQYTGQITVSASETIAAMAVADGYTNSARASATYTVNLPPTPSYALAASPGSLTVAAGGDGILTITTTVAGGFDSSIALVASGQPTGVSVSFSPSSITGGGAATMTITVSAGVAAGTYPITVTGKSGSIVQSATVTLAVTAATPAATPGFSPRAGSYTGAQSVTISDSTPGATIYYTTNGTSPTTRSTVYSGPVTVSSSETLEAIAPATGYASSAVATAAYTINDPANSLPAISSLSPAFTSAGGAAFTLMVNGSGFTAGSTVNWGTAALTTTYFSANQLTARVTASEIASGGITAITVQSPSPGGGTSNAFQFEVDSAGSGSTAPRFGSVTATVAAGSTASYSVTLPSSVTSASVTCLNLPAGAACSYSPTTNTVTIATSAATPPGSHQITVIFAEAVTGAATASLLLPILLLPLVFLRRKLATRGVWSTACLGLVLLAAAAFTGCGGGGSTPTPAPTHPVTSSDVVTLTVQ